MPVHSHCRVMHIKDLFCRLKKKSHFNYLKSPKMFSIYPTFHTFKQQSKVVVLVITFLPHFYTFVCIVELVLILNMHQIFAAERSNWQKKKCELRLHKILFMHMNWVNMILFFKIVFMKTACMNILEIVLHEFLDGRFM